MARISRGFLALSIVATCGFAQHAAPRGIARLIAQDAARALSSDDPRVRGEAALLVAAGAGHDHEARLLALATDPAPAARRRALLALGLLATPVAVERLEAALRTADARSSDDGVVAAYALGLVPVERASTSVARTISRFRRGSWKRQHDALLALLQAMATQPERSELGALRLLREEESMRAEDLRGALLTLLLPIDSSLERRELERVLRRGSAPERRAIAEWICELAPGARAAWREELLRLAQRDRDADVRALAIDGLARAREPRVLEFAARALDSAAAAERHAAAAAMLAVGGVSGRDRLEEHLLGEPDAAPLGPVLEALQAPPSPALVDLAAGLAADSAAPARCRVAAAELLGRSAPARAVPLLRALFRRVPEPELLARTARALAQCSPTPAPLTQLIMPPATLVEDVPRWRALLAAGHPDAARQVLATLQDPSANDDARAAALTAWRQATVLEARESAPGALAEILP